MPSPNEHGDSIGPPQDQSIEGAYTAIQLMGDCSNDGDPSLTAKMLSPLKCGIPDQIWSRSDWAEVVLLGDKHLRILDKSTQSFLNAAASWHQAKMGFAISVSWGRSPETAMQVARLLRNTDEHGFRKLVRLCPDEHLREFTKSLGLGPEVYRIVEEESRRRRRKAGRASSFRPLADVKNWERNPVGRMFLLWLRAGNGAPALCFWSWNAMDSLLLPRGNGGGEGSRTLARRLGLKKGPEHVRECRVKGARISLKVRGTSVPWLWLDFPTEYYG